MEKKIKTQRNIKLRYDRRENRRKRTNNIGKDERRRTQSNISKMIERKMKEGRKTEIFKINDENGKGKNKNKEVMEGENT